ncbi:MAG TPA: ABC transporter permease, partial [bacterium]|nr:ABC transporter permease [bacterium]
MTAEAALAVEQRRRAGSIWARRLQVFWSSWATRVSAVVVGLLILVSLVPTGWWPAAASTIDMAVPPHPPSLLAAPFLGTDHLGRDIFYRILRSARLTFIISGLATTFATVTGVLAGLLAGYFRGWTDQAISRLVDFLLAFPVLLLILALVVALGQTATSVIIVLGLSGWAGYTRVMRSAVLALAGLELVDSARAIGASPGRIVFRHLLPNTVSAIMVMSTFSLAQFILVES